MISIDDIEAFEENEAEAINAADEYARRSHKPWLPTDRYADGADMERLVAAGIDAKNAMLHAKNAMLDSFAEITLQLLENQKEAGEISMSLGEPRED